jgi:hypothetical protein
MMGDAISMASLRAVVLIINPAPASIKNSQRPYIKGKT